MLGAKLPPPHKHMLSLSPFSSYYNQNYSDYRSASVIPICYPGYLFRICNLIDFGHDRLRMHQDLPHTYEGKSHPTYRTQFTIVNISDEPGLTHCLIYSMILNEWVNVFTTLFEDSPKVIRQFVCSKKNISI